MCDKQAAAWLPGSGTVLHCIHALAQTGLCWHLALSSLPDSRPPCTSWAAGKSPLVRKQAFPQKDLVFPCSHSAWKPKPITQPAKARRQTVPHKPAVALQVEAKPITQPRVVDFGKGLGRKSVWLYHLPEVESTHKYMRVPNVSARFGTDPSERLCCDSEVPAHKDHASAATCSTPIHRLKSSRCWPS